MRFFQTTLTAALALLSVPAFAAVTPAQIVDTIKMLTKRSQALQAPASSINIVNGPLLITGQGPFPEIITGFRDIITLATGSMEMMDGTPPVTGAADSKAIADAFREFVRVHQTLLNILIGKSGLFSTVPFVGQPVAAVLRGIENVVDTIAFTLIDMVQAQAQNLQNDANSLSMTLATTIDQYEGLSTSKAKRSHAREFKP